MQQGDSRDAQASPAAGEVGRGRDAKGEGRVAWIDALKGILIILVAAGHLFIPACDSFDVVERSFDVIYLFHMPAFVFVSGFLAKHTLDEQGRLRAGRIVTYLVVGIVFNVALRWFEGEHLTPSRMLTFSSAPWYLVSMAWWMLLVPLFDRLRPSWGVAISCAVSVGAALMSNQTNFLSLSRTAHFLPYFMVGYYLSLGQLQRLRRPRPRVALACAGALALFVYLGFEPIFKPAIGFVFGSADNVLPLSRALPSYLAITTLGVALALGCIALAPSRCRPLETLGRRTFQVYVLHRFARSALVMLGVYDALLPLGPNAVLVCLVALSLLVCLGASWGGFTRVATWVLGLRWRFLLRDDD